MGRKVATLTALAALKLNEPGLHFVGGVPNLALNISESGSRSWILRLSINGRRRDMGIGPFPEVSLAEARDIAHEKRRMARQGVDPIEERRIRKSNARQLSASSITFKAAAEKYMAAHRGSWRNIKHSKQWEATLARYAYPQIASMDTREILLPEILKVVEPIWQDKTETASRLRGRIEAVLDWATVRGYRDGDNPARWKGNLDALLPAKNKVAKVKHYEALPWDKCPEFFRSLSSKNSISANALKFGILTACRSGEVRGARWSEINMDKKVWTIPSERMKAGKEHRVPLSTVAVELLAKVPRFAGEDLLFSNKQGRPLDDTVLLALLRRLDAGCTVHGFRSSFRDWAGESTHYPREVIEHALAHQLKSKAEAAYARGDLFTKRIALMESWAEFLSGI